MRLIGCDEGPSSSVCPTALEAFAMKKALAEMGTVRDVTRACLIENVVTECHDAEVQRRQGDTLWVTIAEARVRGPAHVRAVQRRSVADAARRDAAGTMLLRPFCERLMGASVEEDRTRKGAPAKLGRPRR